MTYASWEPRYRVTTTTPGKLDLFVVTLINGERAHLDAIMDYDDALARAKAFLVGRMCQIKVLPLTAAETRSLFNISVPDHPRPLDAAVRQQMIDTLKQIARDSSDTDARADALHLLTEMGVLQS